MQHLHFFRRHVGSRFETNLTPYLLEADRNTSINEQRAADVDFRLRLDFKTLNRNFGPIRKDDRQPATDRRVRPKKHRWILLLDKTGNQVGKRLQSATWRQVTKRREARWLAIGTDTADSKSCDYGYAKMKDQILLVNEMNGKIVAMIAETQPNTTGQP